MLTYGLGSADITATGDQCGRRRHRALGRDALGSRPTCARRLIGTFNAANLLGVLGVLLASDIALDDALAALAHVEPPPGRMQRLGGGFEPLVVVDYAHSPDALEKVLTALRSAVVEAGELICVFGCGGDRDVGKRPEMGRIAATLADRIIVTSDNPRSENPAAIAASIVRGIREGGATQFAVELDRTAAIRAAVLTRARRRCRAARRQGPRGLPGDARRAPALLRCGSRRRGARRVERRHDGHGDRRARGAAGGCWARTCASRA